MKQSDRIKYVQNYLNNPLRKEYETKEKEIMKNKPITYHILTVIAFFPLFMILGYFIIFILYENDLLKFLNFSDLFPIVLLGLINLPVAVFLPILLDDARKKCLQITIRML